MLYALLAILLFGFLIVIHEFGHFITAKWCGVQVNEFSVGMGPVLWKRQKGETQYSLRLFPIGGYCAMEGEDEASENQRAFGNQQTWKQFLILAAGSVMNFLAGIALLLLLMSQIGAVYVPVVAGLDETSPFQGEEGLRAGDRIVSINGSRVWTYSDLGLLLDRAADGRVDMVVERDGARAERSWILLDPVKNYGIHAAVEQATLPVKLRETAYSAMDYVRLVGFSLRDLVTGQAGLGDMSGPIGIVDTVTQVGESSAATGGTLAGIRSVVNFCAFLAVNLAVMNLLPLPALDGGRIFFLAVNVLFTALTHKKLDPKYEGYVHAAGLFALLGLMALVAVNDILRIVR